MISTKHDSVQICNLAVLGSCHINDDIETLRNLFVYVFSFPSVPQRRNHEDNHISFPIFRCNGCLPKRFLGNYTDLHKVWTSEADIEPLRRASKRYIQKIQSPMGVAGIGSMEKLRRFSRVEVLVLATPQAMVAILVCGLMATAGTLTVVAHLTDQGYWASSNTTIRGLRFWSGFVLIFWQLRSNFAGSIPKYHQDDGRRYMSL